MSDVDDLVRWLREQLDADEQIARAAGGDDWRRQEHPSETVAVYDSKGEPVVYDEGWPTPEQAAHIAAHDPARVLREIDAKRALVKQIFRYEAKIDGEWGCCHDAEEIEAGECEETPPNEIEALRVLALPYADRPGYRTEWRP